MKKFGILILFLFCTSCAGMNAGGKKEDFFQVDIPEKSERKGVAQTEQVQEIREESRSYDAGELNDRLQEIISESSLAHDKGVYQPDEAEDGDKKDLSFSFYDADLVEVIRVFMKLLEEDYMVHPDVSGRVSLFVEDNFTPEQLMDLLSGVLMMNGMAMVKKDKVWEIMPQSKVPRFVGREEIIAPDADKTPGRGQIIQGYRLEFIAASEMINILKPYLSQNAQVYAHESKGVMLVSDYPHNLEKITELVNLFDESVFADVQARVFPLRYIDAEKAAEQLEGIAGNFGLENQEVGPRARVSFMALERLNMVLAVTRSSQVMEFVSTWVEGLDQELPESMTGTRQESIHVYYVQYGDADEIVESLRGVFEEGYEKDNETEKVPDRPDESPAPDGENNGGSSAENSVSGELTGPVVFNVDKTTNAIITRCNSVDYPSVLSVIEKLDLYPKQVLIEVVIAEVRLTENNKMGVDWQYILSLGNELDGEVSFVPSADSIPGSGGVFVLESATRLKSALYASLDDSNLQILSTPTLLASDNKPATINIGDQVPYPTSTRQRLDDTDDTEVVDTTIQYRDTGIILKVTPKINKHGMVRMEIEQEVSSLTKTRVEGINAPVINTRLAETALAVNDQQTIVIAGLMEQQRSRGYSGVPGLGKIPGIKHLFGTSSYEYENTELLVFITPHVIASQEDSGFLTRNFLTKLQELKKEMK
ncbi:MAG: type II secretion system secretin GspD [Desulfonatronovibrionaceae bacterium]